MPSVVRLATPLVKSAARFSTLEPCRPETVPVSGAFGAIVTLSDAALNPATVLPQASWAVRVFVPVKAAPFVCGVARTRANFARAPALTVTDSASAPRAPISPSVTRIVVASAL